MAYNAQSHQEILRMSIGENVGGLYYGQIGVIPDGQNLFLTTVSGVRAFDIGTSQGYLVTLADNSSVDALLFGNTVLPLSIHVAVPGGVMGENQGAGPLTGTVSRTGGDLTIPLVVTLTSSDPTEAGLFADLAATLSGLPSGATIVVSVTARNEAGEAEPTFVTVVIP